ncbi:4384_t:CDS:2, partial [Gigaspora margarita]
MKRQRNSYSVEEKQKAVELAHQTSNTYAANYYSLDLTMLGQWVKQFSQEETQLYEWIKTVRENGLAVIYSNLRVKMAEILSKSSRQTKDAAKKFAITNFKFSLLWLNYFLKHYDLALQCKTKIAQKLPRDLEDQLLSVQQFVIRLYQKYEYPLGIIANMNEMPIWFDMAGSLIVDSKAAKTVHVQTTSNDKNHFTVVLTFVWFQDKSWMDEPGMQKWITYWNSQQLGSHIIVQAFKKCDISNCLSGSEDYLIYDDDKGNIDKSDKYDEDEEFDKDYEPKEGEFDEGNEDDNSNKYNKWPECFVVIE